MWLALPAEPVESNGTWDPEGKAVRWSGTLVPPTRRDVRLPMVCHAKWTVPDTLRQRRLFGEVLVRGDRLADYCAWLEKLDAAQAREWDRMLAGLKPGDLAPLRRFRFADERGARADTTAPSRADAARDLILSAAERRP